MGKQLTRAEMKVAIAQDVILQLKDKRYKATQGTYFDGDFRGYYHWNEAKLQEEVLKIKQCDVCAVGAVLVSAVGLFDGTPGDEWKPGEGTTNPALEKWFDTEELTDMEAAFELYDLALAHLDSDGDDEWVISDFSDSEARMKEVMRSIIAKKGKIDLKHMMGRILKGASNCKKRYETTTEKQRLAERKRENG